MRKLELEKVTAESKSKREIVRFDDGRTHEEKVNV